MFEQLSSNQIKLNFSEISSVESKMFMIVTGWLDSQLSIQMSLVGKSITSVSISINIHHALNGRRRIASVCVCVPIINAYHYKFGTWIPLEIVRASCEWHDVRMIRTLWQSLETNCEVMWSLTNICICFVDRERLIAIILHFNNRKTWERQSNLSA